ncbi:MAG: outer membrane beta-barrel family protein, partial [Flavisolibacter sp.]
VITKMESSQVIGVNVSDVLTTAKNFNFNQGINAKYKLDSVGSEWTTDLSYTLSPNETQQSFVSGNGKLENNLNFFAAQTNLLKKMKKDITVETGLKTTLVGFHNTTDYYRHAGGISTSDSLRSGAYSYKESINAAFVQASKKFSGIILKVGTRLENTNMDGHQKTPVDTSFSIHRTDLFPYVYLSRTIMKIAGYDLRAYLVYRRTINRPSYEYLNPASRIIDPYLFETGNPFLRPQFTQNYEANVSVDERPLIAFGINNTKDIFTQVIYQADTNSMVSKRTYDNLGSNREHYIRFMGAIPPGGKYFFVVGGQYNHNFYEGMYENKPLSYKKGSWTLYTYHQLKLGSLTQVSVNGFVRFNGQQQFYELSTFGELRMSINQQFLKKKLNVTVSMNDIFQTNHNEFILNQGSVKAYGLRESDTRRFGLNVRYNFGWKKKDESTDLNNYTPDKIN